MFENILEGVAAVSFLAIALIVWSITRRGKKGRRSIRIGLSTLQQTTSTVPNAAARRFLLRVFFAGFSIRLIGVLIISLTDAIRTLSLSPDSLRYHEEAMTIAEEMRNGFFNGPNWIDNGWFQFTGLIYYVLGPNPLYIQLINIFLSALTPLIIFRLVLNVFRIEKVARVAAMLVAFLPSFIYWSCLMLKDPLSIFSISLLVLSVVRLRSQFSANALLMMSFSLIMLLGIREYLFFVSLFLVVISYTPVEGRRTLPLLATMAGVVALIGAATYFSGFGVFGSDYIRQSHYFDLEYINQSRINISHGSGAFFDNPESAVWGESVGSTLRALVAAIYFFFVSIDLSQIGSVRQFMALPEILAILFMLPSLFRGLVHSWDHVRQRSLPMAVFAFGLLAVYGSAATNMGAMFRWRMQALPLLLAFMVYGAFVHGRGYVYGVLRRLKF